MPRPCRPVPGIEQGPGRDGAPCEIRGPWQVEPDVDGCQVGTGPPSLEGDGRRSHRWASEDSTSEPGLGGRGQSCWAPWAEEGGSPLPGTPRPEFAGLRCLGSIFQTLSLPATCLGAAILQRRKLRHPETVTTPRATGRPLSNTLQPALPSLPSPPRFPSPRMPTLPPKAGRGREPQTQLHNSNDKRFRGGRGFSMLAVPRTLLPLFYNYPARWVPRVTHFTDARN